MRIQEIMAQRGPVLRPVPVTVPAPASGNTNTATVAHGLTTLTGRPVKPEIVVPVVQGDETRQVSVSVVAVDEVEVTVRVVTSETTMTPVDLVLYVG